jgi:sortase A
MPILFCGAGIGTLAVAGGPVIDLVDNATSLLMLADTPNFSKNIGENMAMLSDKDANSLKSSISLADVSLPSRGQIFGKVVSEKAQLSDSLFFGDDAAVLALGAGMMQASYYPGQIGTCVIGGHNYPNFVHLGDLVVGDSFEIETSYADYTYRVVETQVIKGSDMAYVNSWIGRKDGSYALLYTCYFPGGVIGYPEYRTVVVGQVETGPMLVKEEA